MKTGNLLQDIVGSILSPRGRFGNAAVERPVEELCRELLSNNGDVSGKRIASGILKKYQDMSIEEKGHFFSLLTEKFDLDPDIVADAAGKYRKSRSPENLKHLLQVSEPPRQELLRRLNRVPGATQALVSMRSELLSFLNSEPTFKRADLDFEHLFASWFNRGFLELRPIPWSSQAHVLAKIIQYEAVHAINDWNDLQRRLEPTDRRCYSFFHPSMPDEPLVFVEIALCSGIPDSIQSLLDEKREPLDDTDADTAVFYSISNCQTGLQGVSFGNSLIKQVATDLSAELSNLRNFVTLSPIPGLVDWVKSRPDKIPTGLGEHLVQQLELTPSRQSLLESEKLDGDLKILASKYLLNAKRDDGLPIDPVARFHLGNGASVHQVNVAADTSPKGVQQSFASMVNYLYDMSKTESQHEDFAASSIVHASKDVGMAANGKLTDHTRFADVG